MLKNYLKIFLIVIFPLLISLTGNAQPRQMAVAVQSKPAAVGSVTVITEPNAAVWLDEVRRGSTNSGGRLQIERVRAGTRKLRVRAVGFAEKSINLLPAQRGETKIELVKLNDEAELAFQQAEVLRESPREAADREKSVQLYRQALKLRPRFPAAHVGLARVLEDMREHDAALAEVAAARRDSPNYADASVVEGRIYRAESVADPDNAIKSFRRAIRESKNFNPEAHTGLALAYKDKEDYAASAAEFKIALNQLADAEPVVYQLYGETLEQMKSYKEAIAAYEKYLQLAPTSSNATAVRSIIEQLKRKESGEAIELLPQ